MKVGLLTSGTVPEYKAKCLAPVLADERFEVKTAFVDRRPKKSTKQTLLKNIKRGRGGYILVMAVKKYFLKKQPSTNISTYCAENKISVFETTTPYADATIEEIKRQKLDVLVLVGGFGIVKKKLLDATPKGVLSYHHGNMRRYRGMPPALWELYNGEKEMGVTVQVLAPGLDCGIPVEETTVGIKKHDDLETLKARAYEQSVPMLHRALVKLADPEFVPEKITTFGKVYTLPNLKQWAALNMKVLRRKLS